MILSFPFTATSYPSVLRLFPQCFSPFSRISSLWCSTVVHLFSVWNVYFARSPLETFGFNCRPFCSIFFRSLFVPLLLFSLLFFVLRLFFLFVGAFRFPVLLSCPEFQENLMWSVWRKPLFFFESANYAHSRIDLESNKWNEFYGLQQKMLNRLDFSVLERCKVWQTKTFSLFIWFSIKPY